MARPSEPQPSGEEPDRYLLPQPRRDYKVVRGKDGWLFLDHDSNFVMQQHSGELQLSDDQLEEWRLVLEGRIAWLGERGIPYHFLVVPDSHAVFPEKLPHPPVVKRERPVQQLLRHLEDKRSLARPIYPLEEMVAQKPRRPYTLTSMHWTEFGAFLGYRLLADEIARSVPIRRIGEADVSFIERPFHGDLGVKVDPEEESLHPFAQIERQARLVHDNRVLVRGHRLDLECPAAPAVTCLLHGDSNSNMMLPFLAETFGRLVFGQIDTLDRSLVDDVGPDVVIGIATERFLIRVPDDEGSPSLEELAAEKRARGEFYPPGRSRGDRFQRPPAA